MAASVRLVFRGEILPGHRPDQVKADLSALLKLKRDEIEAIFSGARIVLRKDLPSDQAPRYQAHLEKIGVRVLVEPTEAGPPPLPRVAAATPRLAPEPAAPSAAPSTRVEGAPAAAPPQEVECPKCHERQPPRNLCRSCAVDMPAFAAAQQAAQAEERAAWLEARQAAARGPRANAQSSAGRADAEEVVSPFGVDFDGRIGRRSFVAACMLLSGLAFWAGFVGVKAHSAAILVLALIPVWFFAVRVTILRLHDIGVSGWWWLVTCVPVVGNAGHFFLAGVPASDEDKGYGDRSRPAGVVAFLIAGIVLFTGVAAFGTADEREIAWVAQIFGEEEE